jgi:hypothetical protein
MVRGTYTKVLSKRAISMVKGNYFTPTAIIMRASGRTE